MATVRSYVLMTTCTLDMSARATVELWTAANLSERPDVRHGFTCRTGGFSDAPFASLNLGLHVGDSPACVVENRRWTASLLGFDLSHIVCAAQVHGAGAAIVTAAEAGRGAIKYADALPNVDALVTDTPGLLLTLLFADCVPVFFAGTGASGQPVVAVAHAGWRGMVAGVLANTVRVLQNGFGVAPGTLQAAVGPHISAAHFEVGEEVAAQFSASVVSRPAISARPHVHLADAARERLEAVGIPAAQIHVTDDCTVTHADRYYSHRRDQGRTGRMAAMIGIADEPQKRHDLNELDSGVRTKLRLSRVQPPD